MSFASTEISLFNVLSLDIIATWIASLQVVKLAVNSIDEFMFVANNSLLLRLFKVIGFSSQWEKINPSFAIAFTSTS